MRRNSRTSAVIDVVYLWVDGSDPVWRAKRMTQMAMGKSAEDLAAYGNVEGRYRDNEELRYSLRALEMFFPEHGHIYIVTDGHRPAWLENTERLTIVDHRDLIPASSLPLFNSSHIESYIHHIAGLSDRFIYLNDDCFFGAPVNIEEWFCGETISLAWSNEPAVQGLEILACSDSLANASRLSNVWLSANLPGYVHAPRTFAHAPRPLVKKVMNDLELRIAPELFAGVRGTTFRSWKSPPIVSDFVLRWCLSHSKGTIQNWCSMHLSVGDASIEQELQKLEDNLGALDFFCINDTTDDAPNDDPRLAAVRSTLQSMFPLPSSFERRTSEQKKESELALDNIEPAPV
jgi:hypothetical protein